MQNLHKTTRFASSKKPSSFNLLSEQDQQERITENMTILCQRLTQKQLEHITQTIGDEHIQQVMRTLVEMPPNDMISQIN